MFKIASTLASRVRLANNSVPLVGNTLSWSRNCAVNVIDLKEGRFVPCGDASFIQDVPNPSCDMIEKGEWFQPQGVRYMPVLFHALYYEGIKALNAGVRVFDLLIGISTAHRIIEARLTSQAQQIDDYSKMVLQVSTTAANGDRNVGRNVCFAVQRVGDVRLCRVSKNRKSNSECDLRFFGLMHLDWSYISPLFCTNKKEKQCVLKNPLILIYGGKILSKDVIRRAVRRCRPLLVIAEDVEKEVAGYIMQEYSFYRTKLCIVKPSACTNDVKEIMQDLAIFTGSEVVNSELHVNLLTRMLGSCKEVVVTNHRMTMLAKHEDNAERLEQLEYTFTKATAKRLSVEMAIFKVGGATDAEAKKMYNRVSNALNATNAGVYGVLPSGGVALLHASKELDNLPTRNHDEMCGVQLFQRAIKMPVYTVATTAGFDGSVVVENLLKQDNPNVGFDPTTGHYCNLMESGIIEPMQFLTRELKTAVRGCEDVFLNGKNYQDVKPRLWSRKIDGELF